MDRSLPDMIGDSPAFLDALAHASNMAQINRPVLILGERGTGKELFAGRTHFLSPRWEGPFIKVNCAALSEELLESELFGHEAGAFTGASKRHTGRFERAEGGTLFLDEIGTASIRIQEKLLRVIEYGEYERVGGETTHTANVRVIAATNVDLRAAAAAGRFRADLLDRLAFEVITAPPLRDRVGDIPLLAAHFAQTFVRENSESTPDMLFEGFSPAAMAVFVSCPWPGNVRELKSAVERSIYRWHAGQHQGPVDSVSISPFPFQHSPIPGPPIEADNSSGIIAPHHQDALSQTKPFNLRQRLDDIEKQLTIDALALNGWNQRKASEFLGLTYNQIRGLVRKYDLSENNNQDDAAH